MNHEVNNVFNFIFNYERLDAMYDKKNRELRKLQGDFYTNVQMIDSALLHSVLVIMDATLERLTGFQELVSYHLFEKPKDGAWISHGDGGKEYKWKTTTEFKKAVLQMIKESKKND